MRKYYVFIIKNDFGKIYRHNSRTLYNTLENLYNTKTDEIGYGLSIYEQLCQTFDKVLLDKYFFDKFNSFKNNKHFFYDEKVVMEINSSCVVIVTKHNMPLVFKYLLYYNRSLFVCDFYNGDYFWLEKEYSSNR